MASTLCIEPTVKVDKFEKVDEILAYISSCENIHMSDLLTQKGLNHV